MRQTLILFFLFFCSTSFSQGDRYRLETSLNLQTITYYGTRKFKEVKQDPFAQSKYETEKYNTSYNFSTSIGFNYKLGINWINTKGGHILRQSGFLFFEIYKEEANFELIDFEVGDTLEFPNPNISQDIQVGYRGTTVMQGLGIGAGTEMLYLFKKDNFALGGGLSFVFRRRSDYPVASDFYAPVGDNRQTYRYDTKQLGVVFQLERSYDMWKWYINLNQAVLTTKKQTEKGTWYFPDNEVLLPVSQNLDFRFPLTIQLGAAIQFWKVKK